MNKNQRRELALELLSTDIVVLALEQLASITGRDEDVLFRIALKFTVSIADDSLSPAELADAIVSGVILV